MAILKCKMCGGDIELSTDKTYGTCSYCGSTLTLPKVSDEQRAAAFNRGNHFRRAGDFDKALAVYERMVSEDDTDAEAHWCCALCRFGIEYVEDPASHVWIPTCHRASFDSILEDVDYLAAVEHSDGMTRRQYQKDAAAIAEVQKGVLVVSQNEQPFDVFICYKETDDSGQRTKDSTLAQDVYYQLTEQGRRVFFARITLEDKAGSEYEPYIFAALQSAKVMIVIGTKPEYFSAVWVKNEWSRYLALIKQDRSKILLPCYHGMDPYDLPEQLAVLQSYDMEKIGFIQDLIRGVNKVLDADKATAAPKAATDQNGGGSVAALLERGNLFLEDGDWKSAAEYFERVLDMEPKNSAAYVGKLCAERRCNIETDLANCSEPLAASGNYQKAIRFGDSTLRSTLESYNCEINERNEEAFKAQSYTDAEEFAQKAETADEYIEAAAEYRSALGYKDAEERAQRCEETAKSMIYAVAIDLENSALEENDYFTAAKKFREVAGYKDADAKAIKCVETAKSMIYAIAKDLEVHAKTENDYMAAAEKFREVAGYKDADAKATESEKTAKSVVYTAAKNLERNARTKDDYSAAAEKYRKVSDYLDASARAAECDEMASKRQIVEQMRAQKVIKRVAIISVIALVSLAAGVVFVPQYIAKVEYERAVALQEKAAAEAAAEAAALQEKEAAEAAALQEKAAAEAADLYEKAVALYASGDYAKAVAAYVESGPLYYNEEISTCWSCRGGLIAAGYNHTVGLMAKGTVVAVGENASRQCDVSDWSGIRGVFAGWYHTVGMKPDGTVVAVGSNEYGQCDISDWSGIVSITAGSRHTVGLKADGTVIAVGSNEYGQCDVSDWSGVVAVSAGSGHTVGMKSDGTVVAVGNNEYGQCDVSDWAGIVSIAAGSRHTVGLKSDGTVVAAGDNESGQCDIYGWSGISGLAAGDDHTAGLKTDGTVVAVGDTRDKQCHVSNWSDIIAITAGSHSTVGLKTDGTVVAVGYNRSGQCDVSDWTCIKVFD